MKITKTRLKEIIKEEIKAVLTENELDPIEDRDDLYDWLNSMKPFVRLADILKRNGITMEDLIRAFAIEFPITDLLRAKEVYARAEEKL